MMNKLLEYMGKVRDIGIIESLKIVWKCKIDVLFCNIIKKFIRNKPLKNTIVLASHNDFDTNGGAFYDYLIANGYNKKYRIVWLCRNPQYIPKKLPENVVCYPWQYPNLRRDIEICNAKYFLADDWIQKKVRPEQISIYCTHGGGILKNVKGKIVIPDSVDYVLAPSENFSEILAYQFSVTNPAKRLIYLGYPVNDVLYQKDRTEIMKLTRKKYSKVIVWMPTFRKACNGVRVDGIKQQELGIPLISGKEDYQKLNNLLCKEDILLIIKIHPMQDLNDLKIFDCSNIKVLTGNEVKEKNIDNYRLLRCTDALISDYSSTAAEYFHMNKPIAYCLDDIHEYKIGFVIEDIQKLMPGNKIYSIEDMFNFIEDIANDIDRYKCERQKVFDWLFKYHDNQSCKRLIEFLGLEH